MFQQKRPFHAKKILLLAAVQAGILLLAALFYLFNRGNAFSVSYAPEDYIMTGGKIQDGVVSIDDQCGEAGTFLTIRQPLKKGNYIVRIDYSTTPDSQDNTLWADSPLLNGLGLRSNPATLNPFLQTAYISLDLSRNAQDLSLFVNYGGSGQLNIQHIGVYETSNPYKKGIIQALLLCCFIDFGFFFRESAPERRRILFGLTCIFLVSCYPLYMDYLLAGHDLPFHLLRIEGIYKGLLQGTFPVKIHPVWAYDYGYAVGVFYGDTALYLPAFLRIMGFSIQEAYQLFIAAINLGTVLISYFCFRRMLRSDSMGLLGCLLYTLSLYRLSDVYTRASVGEAIGMMCLPLVLCGFYLIFTEMDPSETKIPGWRNSVAIAFGLTGLIQSHLLSCEMAALFILLTCLVMIRRVFRHYAFRQLVNAFLLTVLLNLNFLVPFLDYYDDTIQINSPEWGSHIAYSIQNKGMFPVQLFGLMQRANGGSWATSAGVATEAAYPLGIALTAGMFLFLLFLLCFEEKRALRSHLPACFCCLMGALALFMSTCYFPWDALEQCGELFHKLVLSLEFPWRFLSVATVLLAFVSCYALQKLRKSLQPSAFTAVCAALLALLVVDCGWYYYDFVFSGEPYRVYDTYELNSMTMYSYDFLLAGTDPQQIRAGRVEISGDAELTTYFKDGTNIFCRARSGKNGGTIDFPLNYYRYYICEDDEGTRYEVCPGTNQMLRVKLPPNFDGNLNIRFQEPRTWRAAELASFLTLAGILAFWLKGKAAARAAAGNRRKKTAA